MTIQEFIDIYTSDDTSGGRKLKITTGNDLSDILTSSDAGGGRAIKISFVANVYSVTTTTEIVASPIYDLFAVTALSDPITFPNPTGTWADGQAFMIRLLDDTSPHAISYGPKYRAVGITLPVTTTASKTTYIGVVYNAADDKFDCISTVTEA